MVVVEDAQRLDGVGNRNAAVTDEQQIFSVPGIGGYGEIVGTEINACGRLVEIDNEKLVVHAVAAAPSRFRLERLRDCFRSERRRKDRRHITVRFLQVDTANLPVGNAIDKELFVLRDFLDRAQHDSRRLVEKCQRIEQTRSGLFPDIVGDRLQ